ncbi:peptidoglycan-binding domain-containing protein [Erwiniaceae bacterium CAU 1747]
MQELSDAKWVYSFNGSSSTYDLSPTFKTKVERFIKALKESGARVTVSAALRPPQRAYLMHWAWMIANRKIMPAKVPSYPGIAIKWDHGTLDKSNSAAKRMVSAYGMQGLHVAPALRSRHTEGNAIDMNISWTGTLKIANASGETIEIESAPSSGMNSELHKVAKTYGVIKFLGGFKDVPHWSTDGR